MRPFFLRNGTHDCCGNSIRRQSELGYIICWFKWYYYYRFKRMACKHKQWIKQRIHISYRDRGSITGQRSIIREYGLNDTHTDLEAHLITLRYAVYLCVRVRDFTMATSHFCSGFDRLQIVSNGSRSKPAEVSVIVPRSQQNVAHTFRSLTADAVMIVEPNYCDAQTSCRIDVCTVEMEQKTFYFSNSIGTRCSASNIEANGAAGLNGVCTNRSIRCQSTNWGKESGNVSFVRIYYL